MFKALDKKIRSLCTPAFIYFIISAMAVAMMMFQNIHSPKNKYCVGAYECQLSNESYKLGFFLGKIIYLIFWTWVLNLMCNAGYKDVAWFFVLLPIIGMFVAIAIIMMAIGAHLKK